MEVQHKQTLTILWRHAGFTLLEMTVVIILSAILMAFATARWTGGPNLNAQAQQLAADIRYTQSLAMTHGQRYRLTITAPNTYAITTITGTAVADTVTSNSTITLSNSIQFGTLTNLPNSVIAFDGRGTPYTNATATTVLAATAIINLTVGGDTRQVQITPNGQVTVT